MITTEELQTIVAVMETHLVGYSTLEVDGYKYGSYFIPPRYRIGTSYLELYLFILEHILSILNDSLDYTDFGFEDEDIFYIINKSNELMFHYE